MSDEKCSDKGPGLSRREFFRAIGRGAALAGLAALAAAMLSKSGSLSRQDHTCTNEGYCRDCDALAGCILPQAQIFRKDSQTCPSAKP